MNIFTKKIIVFTSLISIISIISGSKGWINQYIVVGLIYLLIPFFLLRKEKRYKIIIIKGIILIIPFISIYGITAIVKANYHVIPIILISIFSITASLNIISVKNKSFKIILTTFLIILTGYIGMPNWLNYYFDNENPISIPFPRNLVIKDEIGNNFDIYDSESDLIILDLWSSKCKPCFEGFPEFEKLNKKYLKNKKVAFFSLNLKTKYDNDNSKLKKLIEDYQFSKLYSDENSWNLLNNKSVPKIIIIDKNRKIIYKGKLNNKWFLFYNNINSIINKKLNEKV